VFVPITAPVPVMLGDKRKVKRVAGHDAAFSRMCQIAVEKGPAIGRAGHRHEIDSAKIEKVGDRRAADGTRRIV
jgi:hypothetical protein